MTSDRLEERTRHSGLGSGLVTYHHVRFAAPCNLRCFFCYERGGERGETSIEELKEELERAGDAGYDRVVFGSGELVMAASWRQAVRLAAGMGFRHITLLTNLTLLDEATIEALTREGITGVAGSLFAVSDQEALALAGREGIHSRQAAGLRAAASMPGLLEGLHIIMTRESLRDPWGRIARMLELSQESFSHVIVSAIEPTSSEVLEHPSFTFAHELSWPDLMERADRAGIRLVTQNVPACLLGPYAHRAFAIRKRVARLLKGWPGDGDLARYVNRSEVLFSPVAARGSCERCGLLGVCHRYFEYPRVAGPADQSAKSVLESLVEEERIGADPSDLARGLERMAARASPDPAGGAVE